jgi:competence ComEA-like helix-hairpin-helix protein
MKKLIKSFTSFTRTERVGLVSLFTLLIVLVVVRGTMHLWVRTADDTEKEKKLVAAWETFKRSQPIAKSDKANGDDYTDASDDNPTPLPNIININTSDSATLVRLKGIGPATARKIIARRKNKGLYTNVNQLREVSSMSDATFEILKKHLTVGD